jgi:hypothetical protein
MRHHLLHAITLSASALLLLAACRPVQPVPPTAADTAPVIESVGNGDELTIDVENGVTTIDIVSARGIGAAQVHFPPETAADPIVLRFHLQGLEQAILDNGAQQLEISISSHAPTVVSQSLLTDDGAPPLGETDERRATVELVADDGGEAAIPLQDGVIAVTLPPGFIDAAHPLLTLRWIDFYR